MDRGELTKDQQRLYDRVLDDIGREGLPAATLLLREDVPRRDRAAVADVLAPGAGRDYL